jgi:hypothetical protein
MNTRLLNNCCERVANKLHSTKKINEELQCKSQTKKLQMKKLKQNVGILLRQQGTSCYVEGATKEIFDKK